MAAALQRHVGAGRLTLDEFSTRADAAYRADTLQDLDTLLDDLPGPLVGRSADSHRALLVALVVVVVVVAALLLAGVLVSLAAAPGPMVTEGHTMSHMMGGTGMRG